MQPPPTRQFISSAEFFFFSRHLHFNALVSSGLTGTEPQASRLQVLENIFSLKLDPYSSDLLHNVWTRSVVQLLSVWSDVVLLKAFYYTYASDYLYGPAKSMILCLLSTVRYNHFKCKESNCFITNSHPNTCMCMINRINNLLYKLSSAETNFESMHLFSHSLQREPCKHRVCINGCVVFLICRVVFRSHLLFLCHLVFDPFATPIPPWPHRFYSKIPSFSSVWAPVPQC